MHLQRIILEDEAGLRFSLHQAFNGRLRALAGWPLQIAELNNRNRRVFGSTRRASDPFVQQLASGGEWGGAERNDIAHNCVFPIAGHIETADLLAFRARDGNQHFGQSWNRGGPNASDFPAYLRIVADGLLHEPIDGLFRRQVDCGCRHRSLSR